MEPLQHLAIPTWLILPFELAWNFGKERELIWRSGNPYIREIYVFSRYFPIISQLVNLVLIFYFKHPPLSQALCRKWFAFQYSCSLSLQLHFEAMLLLRVSALYRHNPKIIILAIILFTTETVFGVVAGVFIFLRGKFNPMGVMKPTVIHFALPILFQVCQAIIWALIWFGRRVLSTNYGSGVVKRTLNPVLHIAFRDGTMLLAFMSLASAVTIPYTAVINLDIFVLYPCSVTVLSTACCRLVLNVKGAKPTTGEGFALDTQWSSSSDEIDTSSSDEKQEKDVDSEIKNSRPGSPTVATPRSTCPPDVIQVSPSSVL